MHDIILLTITCIVTSVVDASGVKLEGACLECSSRQPYGGKKAESADVEHAAVSVLYDTVAEGEI